MMALEGVQSGATQAGGLELPKVVSTNTRRIKASIKTHIMGGSIVE